jgi:hypothetical protein
MTERDELVSEITQELTAQLTVDALGSNRKLAEAIVAGLQARGRVYWRPVAPCTVCGHMAERVSTVDWHCGDFCCRCVRKGGGCKVAA